MDFQNKAGMCRLRRNARRRRRRSRVSHRVCQPGKRHTPKAFAHLSIRWSHPNGYGAEPLPQQHEAHHQRVVPHPAAPPGQSMMRARYPAAHAANRAPPQSHKLGKEVSRLAAPGLQSTMLSSPRLTRAPATRSLATRPNVTCSADEHAGARKRGPAVPQAAQRSDVGLSSLLGAPTTQQRAAVAQEPALPPATVLLGAGAAFTAVAANEFAPPSAPHLLQHLDASVHAWVSSSSAAWSAELQGLLAGEPAARCA